jgi:hypothetical protein
MVYDIFNVIKNTSGIRIRKICHDLNYQATRRNLDDQKLNVCSS